MQPTPTPDPPFARTSCACADCRACCRRQPGALAPGDLDRIAAHLGETPEAAQAHFWASPGALAMNTATGRQFRIGTITPRLAGGRCVFLDDDDRCRVHAVAPYGCAMFSACAGSMPLAEAQRRSVWLVRQTQDAAYQALRRQLPAATSYHPTTY